MSLLKVDSQDKQKHADELLTEVTEDLRKELEYPRGYAYIQVVSCLDRVRCSHLVINWYRFPLFVPYLFICTYLFIESEGPPGCGQNNEGPGPVPRRQSRLPELFVTSCRAHHCMQRLFCSAHEAEGKEVGPVTPRYSLLDAFLPEESASLLLESRSGPLGNVQITSNSNSTSRESKGNSATEKPVIFILFSPFCPQ